MPNYPRTVVEFLDHPGSDLAHKHREIRINGSPVLVAKNGVDIHYDVSGATATEVTLRLLPTEIHFTRNPKE